jgi:putative FmdB family regulatory protein
MLYVFKCKRCNHQFDELMSVDEYENINVHCPECSSVKLQRVYNKIPVKFNTRMPEKSYLT